MSKEGMQPQEFRVFALLQVLLHISVGGFLSYNALYTEGEMGQGLCWLLVFAYFPIFFFTIWSPRFGIWCGFAVAAILLPWQAFENRKWAQIHEEIISVIRHLESERKITGGYPESLDRYKYKKEWIDDHVSYRHGGDSYRLLYSMDHRDSATVGYWYDPEQGFGYYPD